MRTHPLPVVLCILFLLALAWSGIAPYDRGTWLMEVAPALIALPVLALTYRRFPLSGLLYVLIWVQALVLVGGGAFTYARMPLGFVLQDWFHLARNPYDRIGHFMQGVVPALVAREILLRLGHMRPGRMLAFVCLCVAMAVSAWYELIEWGAALALGQGADEFLGTQGDPWDTQEDMATAFVGAMCALLLLVPWHDRVLARAGLSRTSTTS